MGGGGGWGKPRLGVGVEGVVVGRGRSSGSVGIEVGGDEVVLHVLEEELCGVMGGL